MKQLRFWALAGIAAIAACSDPSQNDPLAPSGAEPVSVGSAVARVVSSNDAGPGSFRAAVEAANSDGSIRVIRFDSGLAPIQLQQPVVYTGAQALRIEGNDAVLDGTGLDPAADAAFLANGGSDLAISRLAVRNAPQEGIEIDIPAGSSGIKKFVLDEVGAFANRGFGVLINDQANPEDAEDPAGSAASLDVTVTGSRFDDNGFAALDRDGLRINEGGDGDLVVSISKSSAADNGADGIELDERGLGDVRFRVAHSQFTGNGSFDQTLADLDDGIDVDESNEGSLIGTVLQSSANDNKEEGFDFNENHAGGLRVDFTQSEASRNLEEGIDLEEDDDFQGGGDLIARLVGTTTDGNGPGGDAGLKIRERGEGNLETDVRNAESNGNAIGGISIREDAGGSLQASLVQITTNGNASHGMDFDENSTGDLTASVTSSRSLSNGGAGVRADQQLPGLGTLALTATTLAGNAGGSVIGGGVTVTQGP